MHSRARRLPSPSVRSRAEQIAPALLTEGNRLMSHSAMLPPAAVVLSARVADFDAWKAVFDANEQDRIDNGILGHHVNRAEDDPNHLSIYLAVGDTAKARAWMASDALKALMAAAGVSSAPVFDWMTPVRESIVWDRELPAMMVSHRVGDFDTWLAGYDAGEDLQRANGVIGHAANRSLDDPSLAVVYHQAESFETLRSMVESEDLRSAMQAAGVVSEPEVTFYTGGWAKRYS